MCPALPVPKDADAFRQVVKEPLKLLWLVVEKIIMKKLVYAAPQAVPVMLETGSRVLLGSESVNVALTVDIADAFSGTNGIIGDGGTISY